MTITLSTSLLGPVDTDRATIIAAFTGGAYDAPTVATFADAVLARCAEFGFRASVLCGQIAHETKFFRYGGQVQPAQWNFAGLGATNGGAAGASFRSVDEGVCAVLTHHQVWMHGDVQNWPPNLQRYVSLDARYAAVLSTGRAGTVATIGGYSNGNWAYTPTIPIGSLANGYARGIASLANQFTGNPQPPPGGTMRIIVSAGHEHIAQITSDPNGVINAAALRGGTGANGEAVWAAQTADALTALLAAAGVDAVRSDAIYHADVYGPDADLAYVVHYDGGAGTGRAQYCMASTVHSGPSTEAVDALADAFVAQWYAMYPAQMGIAGTGPITTDMLQLYNGWYRTANTPMVIGEHCLGADAGGIRSDRPTPQAAADAVFAVMAKHFNLTNAPPAPPPQKFVIDGHDVGEGFYTRIMELPADRRWMWVGTITGDQYDAYLIEDANDAQRAKGLSAVAHPIIAVDGDRLPLVWDKGRTPPPGDIHVPLQSQGIALADDPALQAILTSMRLANEPI